MSDMEEKKSMLAAVRAAIKAILLGAQSYTIGTRSVTRANLKELRTMERDLQGEIAALETNDEHLIGVRVPYFDRR